MSLKPITIITYSSNNLYVEKYAEIVNKQTSTNKNIHFFQVYLSNANIFTSTSNNPKYLTICTILIGKLNIVV